MRVRIWGARGSVPCFSKRKSHFGTNTSCVEVKISEREKLIFDAGTGIVSMGDHISQKNMLKEQNLYIFLSHFHWDHIQGLPFFKPVFSKDATIHIFGKEGIENVFSAQMIAPFYPVPIDALPAKIVLETIVSTVDVFSAKVKPFLLNHPQGCLGYRVEYERKVVVYATDTEPDSGKYDEILFENAKDADLLIMDSNNTLEEASLRKGWGHSTFKDCVDIAKKFSVKKLILFHHDPFHDDNRVFLKEAQAQREFRNSFAAFEEMQIDV